MRIGAPARKHGVDDADIWHAVRTAVRKIDMDDDLPAHRARVIS